MLAPTRRLARRHPLALRRLLLFVPLWVGLGGGAFSSVALAAEAPPRPNILWISSEDHGQQMGCYGDTDADTPNIDALAARGLLYRHVWSAAPVCAPARTTIVSGIYPTRLGAEHMRSYAPMPPGTTLFPALMRQAGYYCTNSHKEDYNLEALKGVWDASSRTAHYKNREPGQPFFAVFNATVSHESAIRNHSGGPVHDPATVAVPAYHPDTPLIRRDWAIYYDSVTAADAIAGERLRELEQAGLADSTIVFYWADHGSGMPRHKRWPSDSGLRVPLVIYIPPAYAHLRPADWEAGSATERRVHFVDFAPTMLRLIGIEPPAWMQGHAFLGDGAGQKQDYLHGFRGRMDERDDLVRSVTDGRYVYIKNYMPHLSQGQHVTYQMETPTTRQWRALYDEGRLTAAQARFWTVPKDPEELYDLQEDPDEVINLAGSAAHADLLQQFRQAHREHVMRVRDLGFMPEATRQQLLRGQTPYELAADDQRYPLEAIFAAAQLASAIDDLRPETLATLVELMTQADASLRYWGVMGLLMRGGEVVRAHASELSDRLDDDSAAVRVAAARALAQFGRGAAAEQATTLLLQHADWSQHDVFTAMAALAALETLGDRLDAHAETIANLPTEGEAPHPRYSSYVPRLLARLNALAGNSP